MTKPINPDALLEIAKYLTEQRDEPWPVGTESQRLHYWRDKAIIAARICTLATKEPNNEQ